jgi:hypothetical protein
MLDSFVPSSNALLLIYLTIGFLNEAPRALIAKTKNNQSQGHEATLLNALHSRLMSRSRGVHCDNIRKQRAGKYRVIYIHKRKNLEFS